MTKNNVLNINLQSENEIFEKKKLIINTTNINKILKDLKDNMHNINSVQNIESIFIKISNYMYNPNIIKIDDTNKEIKYKINNIEYSSSFIYHNDPEHIFIRALGKNHNVYITLNHILIVLLRKNFIENSSNIMKNDVLISIGITNEIVDSKTVIKLNIDDIHIDNNKVILPNNIKKYPFLSTACREFINFIKINENSNDVSYITISNRYIDKSVLNSCVIDSNNKLIKQNIYYEFKIKDNYLTFKIDTLNQKIYDDIYNNDYYKSFHINFINNKGIDLTKTHKYKSITLETINKLYEKIDKVKDITDDIYTEIIINFVPSSLKNLIEWTELDYDLSCQDKKICNIDKKINIISKIDKLLIILSSYYHIEASIFLSIVTLT
jgi:hypothetical protein